MKEENLSDLAVELRILIAKFARAKEFEATDCLMRASVILSMSLDRERRMDQIKDELRGINQAAFGGSNDS